MQPPPPAGPQPACGVSRHLAALADSLASCGLASRLRVLGGTPVLDISPPAAGPGSPAVAVDPRAGEGPGLALDCTCTWTAAPGADAETTAATIRAVLDAIHAAGQQPASPRPGPP